jgi:PAS domain S-box-containing protein
MAEQARLLDLSSDAIIVCHWSDEIMYWNKGAEELYGYPRNEAVGKILRELLRSELPEPYEQILAKLERDNRWVGETIHTRRDGRLVTVIARWSLSRNAQGRPSTILRTFDDITERKHAEQALAEAQAQLRKHAADLEKQVSERTANLRETVGELEAFSYSIAHDMRAPLRGMRGFSQTLLEEYSDRLDARATGFLQRIARSSARLDMLVQDVLDYAKVLKTPADLAPVDLDQLTRDIVTTYPEYQAPRAQIQIEGHLPEVSGNEAFLTQCISNLLSNAVKFVSPGTIPRVIIWAEPKNNQVRVCFQDNGIGIPADKQGRIFRMFERIHPAAEYEGTGIGLTIARKAAQRMGGDVGFESRPGEGSTFWIQLPYG